MNIIINLFNKKKKKLNKINQFKHLLIIMNHMNMDNSSHSLGSLHTMKVVDGKYNVKNKKLGQGSFAETYLAIENATGLELACKMISKKNLMEKINASKNKILTRQYFIGALKNQVNTWKLIQHQNIVKFIDFSQTPNNIYFFIQFCKRGNLQSYLQKHGYMKQPQALKVLEQIARGCEYLYNKGIFHRDIKTQNILITQNNTVKISDFGFAKMIVDQQMKNNPIDGTSVGTPIYMSPQVLLGAPYTIKCDVWSCGIVFYKILFNLFPWQKTDHVTTFIERMKKQILFPPHIKLSGWIKQMIKGMLTFTEADRLSIKDVVEIIQKNKQNAMDIQ